MTVAPPRQLRIGVDCGGTNTDAVLLDVSPSARRHPDSVVLASFKTPTTPDVTDGIQTSIRTILKSSDFVRASDIQGISIGTTHFVNALVTRAADLLDRVAVIRLCGPFSRRSRPFIGFPNELRSIMEGPVFFVNGGCQIDGREIAPVNEAEIRAVCEQIKAAGITTVAISAVFATIDFDHRHEERVEGIVRECLPHVRTTISKKVANAGLLARENATILNASLIRFAQHTVSAFRTAVHKLGFTCPVFVTSNDGCRMPLDLAAQFPIRTFSSGPTNSMRGASFLSALVAGEGAKGETALVMDIGGTTTEVGILLPTGFPRQAASQHFLCGVRLNFAMPHVTSIGLGGGSVVREDPSTGRVTVGPESVGYRLSTEAKVFGGTTLTATDIYVAADGEEPIGDRTCVGDLDARLLQAAKNRMKQMLEVTIDSMKTSKEDVPVYLAGGGAILCPEELSGVSKIHRFPHYQCANAVGAAVAQISGQVDTVLETTGRALMDLRREVEQRAIAQAIALGAIPSSMKVIEAEALPVAYVGGRCRFVVKAAGEWGGAEHTGDISEPISKNNPTRNGQVVNGYKVPKSIKLPPEAGSRTWTAGELEAYHPVIKNRRWHISELDTELLAIGNYVLGCGGGGDPETARIALLDMLRRGAKVTVMDLSDIDPDLACAWGGMMGSPEVGMERLLGEEYLSATKALWDLLHIDRTNIGGLIANEIGGSNGLVSMVNGASSMLDLPIIDGDFMGRAYPTGWQTTCNVFDDGDEGKQLLPSCTSSGDGVEMFLTKVKHYKECDSVMRAASVELGHRVGHAHRPLPVPYCQKSMVANTISLSWRIGRAVMIAEKSSNIAQVGQAILNAVGGNDTGRVLFAGKIVEVERRTLMGHLHGNVVIEAAAHETDGDAGESQPVFLGRISIPFKNENLLVEHLQDNGAPRVIASVPDLICVLDAGNGRALGTPDYKYGVHVIVLCLTAAPQWTSTKRGLRVGGPASFGYDVLYHPVGTFVKPRSVIDEFTQSD